EDGNPARGRAGSVFQLLEGRFVPRGTICSASANHYRRPRSECWADVPRGTFRQLTNRLWTHLSAWVHSTPDRRSTSLLHNLHNGFDGTNHKGKPSQIPIVLWDY